MAIKHRSASRTSRMTHDQWIRNFFHYPALHWAAAQLICEVNPSADWDYPRWMKAHYFLILREEHEDPTPAPSFGPIFDNGITDADFIDAEEFGYF